MKLKNSIFIIILVFVTLFSSWMVPSFVKKMTDDSRAYPLMYYSSRLKELCIIDFRENKEAFMDIKGNVYPRLKYDSLLPLLNFRQLAMDGTMPDSIDGYAMDIKQLRTKQVMFRFRPADVFAPLPKMGVLLEAMPKRGKLQLPGDYFRMEDDGITFVDAETNSVNVTKSHVFTKEMKKKGFQFPVKNYWGNPTTRKSYEEGYFCLDNNNELYHLKMVNGRPFVKNTGIGQRVGLRWFVMSEVSDKRFYGYVFGNNGEMGILESTEDGGYNFLPMEIRPIDISKDEVTILGNILYWTVKVSDSSGMDCYGLNSSDLRALSSYHQERKRVLWDEISEYLFPVVISPESSNSGHIGLYVDLFSYKAFALSLLMALGSFVFIRKRLSLQKQIFIAVMVFFTGLSGLIALFFVPYNRFDK